MKRCSRRISSDRTSKPSEPFSPSGCRVLQHPIESIPEHEQCSIACRGSRGCGGQSDGVNVDGHIGRAPDVIQVPLPPEHGSDARVDSSPPHPATLVSEAVSGESRKRRGSPAVSTTGSVPHRLVEDAYVIPSPVVSDPDERFPAAK